jgi:hypothetical protein
MIISNRRREHGEKHINIQKGYDAAASICRIDKHSAYTDWKKIISTLPISPSNPVGHFIDFCKKRA